MRIILDLDEVLVDFVGGSLKAHGWTKEQYREKLVKGDWGCLGQLLCNGGGAHKFWQPIHALGAAFWENLDEHPWCDDLLAIVKETTDDWYIVSSPSHSCSSYTGKVRWLKNKFGSKFDKFALIPHKHIFANKDTILIDDREESVNRFVDTGGQGIVFPNHGNSQHEWENNPLTYVRTELHMLKKVRS